VFLTLTKISAAFTFFKKEVMATNGRSPILGIRTARTEAEQMEACQKAAEAKCRTVSHYFSGGTLLLDLALLADVRRSNRV
jgi:hypothetical protein